MQGFCYCINTNTKQKNNGTHKASHKKPPSHHLAKTKGECNSIPNYHVVKITVTLDETTANVVGRASGYRGEDRE